MVLLLALLMGVVAGLRAMTAPAAVSWAAYLGLLPLAGSWLAFLGRPWTPWILTVLALAELVGDQLPKTPSRLVPVQFGTRILTGSLAGAAIGVAGGGWSGGAMAGAIGAILGTFGGHRFRSSLAKSFGRDLPAALIEDAIAIGAAIVIVLLVR